MCNREVREIKCHYCDESKSEMIEEYISYKDFRPNAFGKIVYQTTRNKFPYCNEDCRDNAEIRANGGTRAKDGTPIIKPW